MENIHSIDVREELHHAKYCQLQHVRDEIGNRIDLHPFLSHNVYILCGKQLLSCRVQLPVYILLQPIRKSSIGSCRCISLLVKLLVLAYYGIFMGWLAPKLRVEPARPRHAVLDLGSIKHH